VQYDNYGEENLNILYKLRVISGFRCGANDVFVLLEC
jgi:hypothetical protein